MFCEILTALFSVFDSSLFPSQEWFTIYEHNRRTNCTASDLIMGNEYMFRVYSDNLCGMSDAPCQSKNTAKVAKTGLCTRSTCAGTSHLLLV